MSCGIRGEKCITLGPASIDYTSTVAKPIEPLKQFFITTASKKPYFRQPCLSTLKKISRG
ncbi:hypothetical protein TYRP_014610 [Tyrophagus putrescentiae]|nr:hypothetical protein TYRP_014610 [Tyrophagus putrescentiae]